MDASRCGNGLLGRLCCCFAGGRAPAYLAGETEHLLGGVARTTPSDKERELANRYWAKAVDCHSAPPASLQTPRREPHN